MSCTSLSSHAITSHIKLKALFSPAPHTANRAVWHWWKTGNSRSAMQPSLASPPPASFGTETARSDELILTLSSGQITQHVEQCNKCQHLRSSLIFSPGNFRMTKIYGTSDINRNSFNSHAEKVLSSASATQIWAQSTSVQPNTASTHTNLTQGEILTEGKALLVPTESDQDLLCLIARSKKCIKFPGFQTCFSIRTSTQTQGQSDKSLNHLVPTYCEKDC